MAVFSGMTMAIAQDTSQWVGGYAGLGVQLNKFELSWYSPGHNATNVDGNTDLNLAIHGGYNFGVNGFVFGVEVGYLNGLGTLADISCSLARGEAAGGRGCRRKITDVFTLGGIIGKPVGNSMLGYVSAGYANADMATRGYNIANGLSANDRTSSERHDGFYVGIGARKFLHSHFILSGELRQYEFSTSDDATSKVADRLDVDGNATSINVSLSYKF